MPDPNDLTIIRADDMVYVERRPLKVNCSIMPVEQTVLQWHFGKGEIEFLAPDRLNEKIDVLPAYALQLIEDWKVELDKIDHPEQGLPIEELRARKASALDNSFRRSNHSPITFRVDGQNYQFDTTTMVLVDILTAAAFIPPGSQVDWPVIGEVDPITMDVSMLSELGEAIVRRRGTFHAIKVLKLKALARLTTKEQINAFNVDVP